MKVKTYSIDERTQAFNELHKQKTTLKDNFFLFITFIGFFLIIVVAVIAVKMLINVVWG